MNATIANASERTAQAIEDFSVRWGKAVSILCAVHTPQWKRTRQAIWCFQGLPLDHLPPRLYRRVDLCFGRINHVLAGYTLRTDEDYRQVSTEDLTTIAKLLYDLL